MHPCQIMWRSCLNLTSEVRNILYISFRNLKKVLFKGRLFLALRELQKMAVTVYPSAKLSLSEENRRLIVVPKTIIESKSNNPLCSQKYLMSSSLCVNIGLHTHPGGVLQNLQVKPCPNLVLRFSRLEIQSIVWSNNFRVFTVRKWEAQSHCLYLLILSWLPFRLSRVNIRITIGTRWVYEIIKWRTAEYIRKSIVKVFPQNWLRWFLLQLCSWKSGSYPPNSPGWTLVHRRGIRSCTVFWERIFYHHWKTIWAFKVPRSAVWSKPLVLWSLPNSNRCRANRIVKWRNWRILWMGHQQAFMCKLLASIEK